MTGDLILHRSCKVTDFEGPLRILAAAEMPDGADAAMLSAYEGKALALALLHFLPRLTVEYLIHTLIDATVVDTWSTTDRGLP